jgi:hypothetical protein
MAARLLMLLLPLLLLLLLQRLRLEGCNPAELTV